MSKAMQWKRAETVTQDDKGHYLVSTNANEWGDWNLEIMAAFRILQMLQPIIRRGRPIWVAKITNPDSEEK